MDNFRPGATESFRIREAVAADATNIARLHVATFVETHGGPGPSIALREQQWRDAFDKPEGMFCFVVEDRTGGLIGFAKGETYTGGLAGYDGELNKIYVLRRYHRRGLGRNLVCRIARRFLSQGVNSMLLFGDAQNASNGFYEHLGAKRLITASGEFHGGYGWTDLRELTTICPPGESGPEA